MSTVKNVTQYTVALGVANPYSPDSLLSQLKEFSRLDNSRIFVTRRFWAKELGIDRKTIQRWEDELINEGLWFLGEDYWKGGHRKMLDCYQRFIISLIYSMKNGIHPFVEQMTHKRIVEYMCSPKGNPFWLGITREEFNKIEVNYSRKAG